MTFIDELDRKITSLGNGVLKKSKEVSDTAKISSEIKHLESRKKECFEYLGEKFFFDYSEIAKDTETQIFDEVEEIIAQLEHRKKQMQQIKGIKICKTCNAEITANSAFCQNCGTAVESYESVQIKDGKCCPICGGRIEENQMFCTNCGNRIEKTAVKKQCKYCGGYVEENQIFCENCGNRINHTSVANIEHEGVEEDGAGEFENIPNVEIIEHKICPNCGEKIMEEQKFCMNCGMAIR